MARLILAFCALGAYALVPPRTTRTTTRLHGELGERTSVTLIKGAQPKKLRKKVRRSRSPLLYPAKTAGGGDCFLQLSSDQKHLATSETPMSCFVSRVIARDGDEQQDDDDGVLVMTPTPAEIRQRAPVAPEATNFHPGKLLGDLRTNEKVEAVVLRHIARDVALVAVRGVFRASKAGYRRQSAALPGGGDLAIGDSVDCYVRLSEPNSGRLTVSLAPGARTLVPPKSAMVFTGSGLGADLSIVTRRTKTMVRQREAIVPRFLMVTSNVQATVGADFSPLGLTVALNSV